MSTAEGWYDDPSAPGRLRYWDGSDWTEWVNENDETRSEPLGAPPPAGQVAQHAQAEPAQAAATPQPAPAADSAYPGVQPAPQWADTPPTVPPAGSGPGAAVAAGPTPLQRIGFAIIGVAGVVALFSIGQAATRLKGGTPPGYDVGSGPFIVGIGFVVAAVLGLFIAQTWARVVAVVGASLVLLLNLFFLIGARGGDLFPVGAEIEIKPGWWILTASSVIAIVGITAAAVGSGAKRKNVIITIVAGVAALAFIGLLIMAFVTDPSASWVKDSR